MARSKKSLKKIQSLIFLMLITLLMGLTATYAWFSTQRDVEISGMRINVEVAESMQISLDGEKWTQSINIADMKQFYGTYNSNGTEGFAIYQAKNGANLNYVPTELLPVSTAGEVSSGKLQFVQGTVATNSDGSQSLTGITKCTETDITLGAEIDDKEENNKVHPYLVFDIYLRNISAKTTGIDELKLNKGSSVYINTATTDDSQQEGKGVVGTGLEYSARVGMIVYGNTVSVTAKDDVILGTVAEQVRGITPNNSEVAAIWEPNYRQHTQYVVDNNGRGITSRYQEVATYGIKSAVADQASPNNKVSNINADTDANTDGIEDTNANLVAVNTFKPEYTIPAGVNEKTTITDTAGSAIGLLPNQISKVRIYIWLEGQDPDCIDLASTGDKLNISLKLIKDQNTINNNTYDGEYVEGGSGSGSENTDDYITAETLTTADYGGYVTNYNFSNISNWDNYSWGYDEYYSNWAIADLGINGWQIFHTDGENIYLIADELITARPKGKNGTRISTLTGNSDYDDAGNYWNSAGDGRVSALDTYVDYAGTSDISSNLKTKLLSQYTTTSTNINARATAYLLDTNIWAGLKDSNGYADYVIGSPTLELYIESYNALYRTNIIPSTNATGYTTSYSELDTTNYLYVNRWYASGEALWLASPSGADSENMMVVTRNGSISNKKYNSYLDSSWLASDGTFGVRPVIVLNSNVKLQKTGYYTYEIVEH